MKLYRRILFILIFLFIASLVFVHAISRSNNQPIFLHLDSEPRGPYGNVYYFSDNLFVGGCLWLHTRTSTTNRHQYLFDISQSKIIGELTNASPVCLNRDRSILLSEQVSSWRDGPFGKIASRIEKASAGSIKFSEGREVNTFFINNLHDNSVKQALQFEHAHNSWVFAFPSPDGARVYVAAFDFSQWPLRAKDENSFVIDVKSAKADKLSLNFAFFGWYDDQQILAKDTNSNFVICDVLTHHTNILCTHETVERFLSTNRLLGLPSDIVAFTKWNGSNNDVYLGLQSNFIAKVEYPASNLKLLHAHCDFPLNEPQAFDTQLKYFVDGGPSPNSWAMGQGGVYLHNLTDNTLLALIPPNPNSTCKFQNFYHEKVIYLRNNEVWSVDVTGSNNVRLFPPKEN